MHFVGPSGAQLLRPFSPSSPSPLFPRPHAARLPTGPDSAWVCWLRPSSCSSPIEQPEAMERILSHLGIWPAQAPSLPVHSIAAESAVPSVPGTAGTALRPALPGGGPPGWVPHTRHTRCTALRPASPAPRPSWPASHGCGPGSRAIPSSPAPGPHPSDLRRRVLSARLVRSNAALGRLRPPPRASAPMRGGSGIVFRRRQAWGGGGYDGERDCERI